MRGEAIVRSYAQEKLKDIVFQNYEVATGCHQDLRSSRPTVSEKHIVMSATHLRRPSKPFKVERYNFAFLTLPIDHRP